MDEAARPRKVGVNWWKLAFFVTLILFEIAREWAVAASSATPIPNSMLMVNGSDSYASAQGSWKRADGGSKMVPGTVAIECRRNPDICIEASTMIYGDSVFAPEVDFFPATFAPGIVTYENDIPSCAKYSVTIDLKQEAVNALRVRKPNPDNANCVKLEPRVSMRLDNGYEGYDRDRFDDHFLPIFKFIDAVT